MEARSKTASAFIWSFVERIGVQVLRGLVAIVLTRLLLPADFGLIAMLSLFIGVAQIIVTSGFATVLIRKPQITEDDLCSVFYFNLLIGFLLTATFFLATPPIAAFFHAPQLRQIGRVTSLNILVNSFC